MTQPEPSEAPFTNLRVDLGSLPRFDEVELRRLDPRYAPLALGLAVAFEVLALVLAGAVVLLGPESRAAVTSWPGLAIPLAVVGFLALVAWFVYESARVKRFAVREHDVIVHSGVFWKREVIQPIGRIQHVEQVQGPIARRFGLYRIRLFSAGTGQFAFEIPGLDEVTASRLRQAILSLRDSKLGASGERRDGAAAPPSSLQPAASEDA